MKLTKTTLRIEATTGKYSYRATYTNDKGTSLTTATINADSNKEARTKLEAMAKAQNKNILIKNILN